MKSFATTRSRMFPSRKSLGLFIAVVTAFAFALHLEHSADAYLMFQSPLPAREEERVVNTDWIVALEGGIEEFGKVTVNLPSYFTNQGGANVIGNMIIVPVGIENNGNLLPGTEFALGVWPANDQTEYQQPIEIRIVLNASSLTPNTEDALSIVRYDPSTEQWVALPTIFDRATYALVSSTTTMTPVAKDFPEWGGRTFFAVTTGGITSSAPNDTAEVIRPANIRRGPGVSYQVVRVAKVGEVVTPIGQSSDGKWLQLDDQTWIAAFLVRNAPKVPTIDAKNALQTKP